MIISLRWRRLFEPIIDNFPLDQTNITVVATELISGTTEMTDVITEVTTMTTEMTTMTAEHLSTRGSFHFDIPLVYACSIVQLVTSSMSNHYHFHWYFSFEHLGLQFHWSFIIQNRSISELTDDSWLAIILNGCPANQLHTVTGTWVSCAVFFSMDDLFKFDQWTDHI